MNSKNQQPLRPYLEYGIFMPDVPRQTTSVRPRPVEPVKRPVVPALRAAALAAAMLAAS